MKLVITCDLDPDGQPLDELRARIHGHASLIREHLRSGWPGMGEGVGIETFVLPGYNETRPKLKRINIRVEP